MSGTPVIRSLSEIASGYDAVLCDLWGVYHNGVAPHATAVAALRQFRENGGSVALLTNAPRPHFSVAKQLAAMGAPTDSHDAIVSSGDATVAALKTGAFGDKCCHIGPDRDLDLFADLGIERVSMSDAEFILCSGLFDDSTEGPEDYAETIAEGLALGLTMLCANPDVIVDRGERRLYCAGAIAAAYENAGGAVRYFGKPHAPVYQQAVARVSEAAGRDFPRARILAIGDGPATDIRGAAENGFDSLFVAGGLAAETLLDEDGAVRCDRLPDYFSEHNIEPTYTIAMLA